MKPIVITNNTEHELALDRLTVLMDLLEADISTAADDELDMLVNVIEAYETEHYPIDTTTE